MPAGDSASLFESAPAFRRLVWFGFFVCAIRARPVELRAPVRRISRNAVSWPHKPEVRQNQPNFTVVPVRVSRPDFRRASPASLERLHSCSERDYEQFKGVIWKPFPVVQRCVRRRPARRRLRRTDARSLLPIYRIRNLQKKKDFMLHNYFLYFFNTFFLRFCFLLTNCFN